MEAEIVYAMEGPLNHIGPRIGFEIQETTDETSNRYKQIVLYKCALLNYEDRTILHSPWFAFDEIQ